MKCVPLIQKKHLELHNKPIKWLTSLRLMEKSVRKSQPNAQKPAAAVEMKSKELIPEWWWAALLAIVCYIVTFGHGFVLDDSTIFKNNYLFQPGATKVVSTLFKTGYWYGYTHSNVGVYRPLPLVVL